MQSFDPPIRAQSPRLSPRVLTRCCLEYDTRLSLYGDRIKLSTSPEEIRDAESLRTYDLRDAKLVMNTQ